MPYFHGVHLEKGSQRWLTPSLVADARMIRARKDFQTLCSNFTRDRVRLVQHFPRASFVLKSRASLRVLQYVSFLAIEGERSSIPVATISNMLRFNDNLHLMSRNSVISLLKVLIDTGYLEEATCPTDRRCKILQRTKLFKYAVRSYIHANLLLFFETDLVNPAVVALFADDKFFDELVVQSVKRFDDVCAASVFADLNILFEKTLGLEIILMVFDRVIHGRNENLEVSLPYCDVEKRFGVSRGHVRNVVNEGKALGFFECVDRGGERIVVRNLFIKTVEAYLSVMFTGNLRVLNSSVDEFGRKANGNPPRFNGVQR